VQLGYDGTYGKPKVKTYQPSYKMNYIAGMSEYHDCREVDAGHIGYFKVECKPSVSHDIYSEAEFDAEWGIGNLTIANASYNSTLNEYQPRECIKDTFMPNLESMSLVFPQMMCSTACMSLRVNFRFWTSSAYCRRRYQRIGFPNDAQHAQCRIQFTGTKSLGKDPNTTSPITPTLLQ
jgi:hypothetical protein